MNGKSLYRQVTLLAGLAVLSVVALWWTSRPGPATGSAGGAHSPARVHVRAVADGDTLLDRTVIVPDSATVALALEAATGEGNVALGMREYDFGVLVVKIGPRAAGPDGDWTYRVNDSLPPVGVHQCRVHDGDRINFHFGKRAADSTETLD